MADFDPSNLDLSDLDDDQIHQLMQLGVIPEEQEGLQNQMNVAQKLRDRGPPKGQTVGPDGIYVAANPLEHLAYAMQGIKAGKDLEKLRDQQQGLLNQQVDARQIYADALRGRKRVGKGPHSFTVGKPPMQDIPVDPIGTGY